MGKRIAIGLLAVLIIGVAAYMLSQPKEGTVEWHKRKCENAMRALNGEHALLDRARNRFGLPPRRNLYQEHRQALTDLGYLEEREFILTNSPEKPSRALVHWATNEIPQDRLWSIGLVSNKFLVIRAERHSMKKWEEAVRRIDVPKSAK